MATGCHRRTRNGDRQQRPGADDAMLTVVKWNNRQTSIMCRKRIAPSMPVNGTATDA
jgi:hypothetical protein